MFVKLLKKAYNISKKGLVGLGPWAKSLLLGTVCAYLSSLLLYMTHPSYSPFVLSQSVEPTWGDGTMGLCIATKGCPSTHWCWSISGIVKLFSSKCCPRFFWFCRSLLVGRLQMFIQNLGHVHINHELIPTTLSSTINMRNISNPYLLFS